MPIQLSGAAKAPIRIAQSVGKSNSGLPTAGMPVPTIPPEVARVIPSRTLTSHIPPVVRDLARFAAVARHQLPSALGGVHKPAPRNGPIFNGSWSRQPVRGWLADYSEDSNGDKMFFQYNPEEVEIDPSVLWIISPVPGRSHPFVQWGGSGQKKISFELKLNFADASETKVGNVADCVNWLHSFCAPNLDMATGQATAPKRMLLYLGGMLAKSNASTDAAAIPVLLLRAPVKYSKLMRPDDLMPLYAELRLEFLALLPVDSKFIEVSSSVRTSFHEADARARAQRLTQPAGALAGGA